MLGELVALMSMAFALGMDAFSIGLGMGMYKLRIRRIVMIGITVGFFHTLMPLLGMAGGKFLSTTFGTFASYAGGILLMVLGIQMLLSGLRGTSDSIIAPVGFGLFLFALSVSLDSFSVGLTLGIYGAKTWLVLLCFGTAAAILTWAGLLLGRKVQGMLGKYSVVLGGAILFAFGFKILGLGSFFF
ncbi:manganese efflux pump MntP family protein [Peribacillus kribbensis]|uniref:manganese efflux pump MntP n=1 Tax=Peribacillus kribbensis TaxID=356658 RepID=UPI00047BA261|nr:manganese efflux pump MntP family protein [Peribacillus kribbensis]